MFEITEEVKEFARAQAGRRCECVGANCRHHLSGARCKRGLRDDQWKVYWRSESGGMSRDNIEAWCLVCFDNNFTVPTSTVTILRSAIAGYTHLADEDQRKAITLMSVFRDAADRVASERHGRLLKAVTDEVWLEFAESTSAVDAAVDLQSRFHDSAVKLNLPTPDVCTGIHCGEVTRSRTGDIFGDALSMASLIKSLADAGQIVLSESVVGQLDSRIELEDLGVRPVEGLPEPVSCWAVRFQQAPSL